MDQFIWGHIEYGNITNVLLILIYRDRMFLIMVSRTTLKNKKANFTIFKEETLNENKTSINKFSMKHISILYGIKCYHYFILLLFFFIFKKITKRRRE